MNLNYIGSVAEQNLHFTSSIEVVQTEKNEVFNTLSVYIPKRLGQKNIVDFDSIDLQITDELPAVLICDVSNYAKIMRGELLSQYQDVFRQNTNIDLVVVLIVFNDEGEFVVTAKDIEFLPLSKAFKKLFFASFIKILFDETYDGKPIVLPAQAGVKAQMSVVLANTTDADVTIPEATHVFVLPGGKSYSLTVEAETVLAAGEATTPYILEAATTGRDTTLIKGTMDITKWTAPFVVGVVGTIISFVQGEEERLVEQTIQSKYFDLSLCLSYQCKLDLNLSWFLQLTRLYYSAEGFPAIDGYPDTNVCRCRSLSLAQEVSDMTALDMSSTASYPTPRNQLFWGALNLIDAQNTTMYVHSESANIISLMLSAWFKEKNASGQFVGNKTSLLRLSGNKVKPLGYPSPFSSEVNENDSKAADVFPAKNIGYLKTISGSSVQESCLTMSRGITGTPLNAAMIAKYIDYTAAQTVADMLTATDTLIDPMLTDEKSYQRIQNVFYELLLQFAKTQRIYTIVMKFPAFSIAKTGMTKLEAATAWAAGYKDDLDSVTVSGGITAS